MPSVPERSRHPDSFGTVILAGGRASRLGGIAKPLATIGGRTLLDLAVAAAPVGRVVVVGPPGLVVPTEVLLVREDPPFGGPVAALTAGVAALPPATDWVLLLAADQPTVRASVRVLLAAHEVGNRAVDGVIGVDGADRRQPLAAVYRCGRLRNLVQDNEERPRRLVDMAAMMTLSEVRLGDRLDVDTEEDARQLGVQLPATVVTAIDHDHPAR